MTRSVPGGRARPGSYRRSTFRTVLASALTIAACHSGMSGRPEGGTMRRDRRLPRRSRLRALPVSRRLPRGRRLPRDRLRPGERRPGRGLPPARRIRTSVRRERLMPRPAGLRSLARPGDVRRAVPRRPQALSRWRAVRGRVVQRLRERTHRPWRGVRRGRGQLARARPDRKSVV